MLFRSNCPVSIGSQGGVGPHGAQVGDIPTAISKGYVVQDSSFTFPDTTLPSTAGMLPVPTNMAVTATYTFTTNATTSTTYPNPAPGPVATNQVLLSSTTYPTNSPLWVTTNSVSVTASNLPTPVVAGTLTNIYTVSQTTLTYPAKGTYVGGVSTNVVTKGPPSGRGKWYIYNLITYETYTYNTYSYTWPACSYTCDAVNSSVAYTTNCYNYYLGDNATN